MPCVVTEGVRYVGDKRHTTTTTTATTTREARSHHKERKKHGHGSGPTEIENSAKLYETTETETETETQGGREEGGRGGHTGAVFVTPRKERNALSSRSGGGMGFLFARIPGGKKTNEGGDDARAYVGQRGYRGRRQSQQRRRRQQPQRRRRQRTKLICSADGREVHAD